MKWPLKLLIFLMLLSNVNANTSNLGQANGDDCDGACTQDQASGGESAGVLVAALGPIANASTISEQQNGLLCTFAKDRSWEDLNEYVSSQNLRMSDVLESTVCRMSESTVDTYTGNIFHASARYSGFVADIVKFSTRYLLKDIIIKIFSLAWYEV